MFVGQAIKLGYTSPAGEKSPAQRADACINLHLCLEENDTEPKRHNIPLVCVFFGVCMLFFPPGTLVAGLVDASAIWLSPPARRETLLTG